MEIADFLGAGEGIRTLDPNLGKVVLLCEYGGKPSIYDARSVNVRASFAGFRGQWARYQSGGNT